MSTETASMSTNTSGNENDEKKQRRRKRRWGDATAATTTTSSPGAPAPAPLVVPPAATGTATTAKGPIDSKAKALALQESVKARLAALKARTAAGAGATTTTTPALRTAGVKRPAPNTAISNPVMSSAASVASTTSSVSASASASTSTLLPPSKKRAKHYELDLSVTGPTFKQEVVPPKPKVNPYLAHLLTDTTEAVKEADQKIKSSTKKGVLALGDSMVLVKNEEPAVDESATLDFGVDERVQASKVRKRHKALTFVEPGTFVEIAERKRRKAMNAEQSGFVSGRKAGNFVTQQTIMANIYGATQDTTIEDDDAILAVRSEANDKTSFPQVVEWWDMELLPKKLKKQVAAYEGKLLQEETQSALNNHHLLESKQVARQLQVLEDTQGQELQSRCFDQAALSYSKTAALIQHIVPIKPLHVKEEPSKEPTLYLTKKELKRQRKLRRQEKQRELQDLQAAGLVAAPEPRLTLQNFIRVLGDQAYVDPSQMEQKVLAQMEARQRAHMERNEAAKLTKEQRAAKLERKLYEDTSETGVHVALFYVKDLSHPYHRTKVDLNAQQNNITGGVIECQNRPQLACVICEGGPKAIKRYIRLMTVRMKWKGLGDDDDEGEEEEKGQTGGDGVDDQRPKRFSPDNACELVWTGMATKRFFKGFVFQSCETGPEAAKILRAKGVGHFWDQMVSHHQLHHAAANGGGSATSSQPFSLRLVDSDGDGDDADSGDVQAMEED